ncbi:MAG: ankyrin repeat domain-containing protein [Alphaproteobacteria bacterium]|nr:ankyrin repeat domain-containing protein [Alphaproteobacteria bacterium]
MLYEYGDEKYSLQKCHNLIDQGIDVHATDDAGKTSLIYAAMHGDVDMLRKLIAMGANVNHQDGCDDTALLWAVSHDDLASATLLLENGADPNLAGRGNYTPLMATVRVKGGEDVAQALMRYGADATQKDAYGEMAEEHARYNGNHPLTNSLYRHRMTQTFTAAAERGTTRPRKIHRATPKRQQP